MPIYEFYCPRCHTIFSFLARRIHTGAPPHCPDCGTLLQKEVSLFAHPRHAASDEESGTGNPDDFPLDDARIEQAMASMAGDIDQVDENDPRQAARLMRKFSDVSGMRFNESMQEALDRMEAGEDPESVESELGEALENEDPFVQGDAPGRSSSRKKSRAHRTPPRRDPVLRDMNGPMETNHPKAKAGDDNL